LDTDYNLPDTDFAFSNGVVSFFDKDPSAGNDDPCQTASNVEYELRRTSTDYGIYFNIYPSAGDGPYVIFI
jgi:hypothetical protein